MKDRRLHDLYADFWSLHYRYQHEEPRAPRPLFREAIKDRPAKKTAKVKSI